MLDDIPQVDFHPSKNGSLEFEVLLLNPLFSRNPKLDCPLDHPHRVSFYQILYITKGEGRHYIDFKPYKYAQDSLLFISAGQVHAFEVDIKTDGFLILFTEDFLTQNMSHSDILSFSRLFNSHLYPPDILSLDTSASIFKPIITEIYNEYIVADTFAKEEILRTLVKLLLLKVERVKRRVAPKEKNSEWVTRFTEFKHLLSMHCSDTRNAQYYAEMMSISYTHLNKIVKAVTGSTAKTFIDSFIILEIKRQLAISDISIKELTYLMGFDEPTNFVKYFKRQTGQSPARFRKTMMAYPAPGKAV